MKVLIATHNPAKLKRYQSLLKDIATVSLLSLADLRITHRTDEPYETAKENAIYKASEYAKLSNLITIAIDEAVKTNFLSDTEQPGVFVRRIHKTKEEVSDEQALAHWKEVFLRYPHADKQFIWDFSIV